MKGPLTETELLELIEGGLDAKRAKQLEARLARDPRMQGLIERLRADRSLLRTAPAPGLPRDFLVELEPLLARPLLMDSGPFKPGEFRRRHQRGARLRRRLAIAAGILLVPGLVGAWLAIDQLLTIEDGEPVALDDQRTGDPLPQLPGDARTVVASDPDAVAPTLGEVHHRWKADHNLLADARRGDEPRAQPSLAGRQITAPFAIVLSTAVDAEAALLTSLEGLDGQTALVRNLTLDDAREIERAWLANHIGATRIEVPLASAENAGNRDDWQNGLQELARRVGEQSQRAAQPARASDGLIHGDRRVMPPYHQQLDFATDGAAFAVTIPLDQLDPLLAILAEQRAQVALTLCGEAVDTTATGDPRTAALRDRPAVIDSLRSMRLADPHTLIWVPVRIIDN